MDANAVFCPNCGEKVVHQANTNTNFNNPGNPTHSNVGGGTAAVQKKSSLNMIIPIVIIAVLAVGAFMIFSGGGNKPEAVVNNFFKAIDKVDPDMMLDTLSSQLKQEALEDVDWDKSELAYELTGMREEFRYEYGDGWLKQVKISGDYKDKTSAVVSFEMFGQRSKVRLMKEGKKWVVIEFPW